MRTPSRPLSRKSSAGHRCSIELLEDRIAPAYVGIFSGPANGKTLTLTGDNAGHLITVATGGTSTLTIQDAAIPAIQTFDLTGVVSIVFVGGAVQDAVYVSTDVPTATRSVAFDGGTGADQLVIQGTLAGTVTNTIGTVANTGSASTGAGAIAYSNVGYVAFANIGTLNVQTSPGADDYTLNGNFLVSNSGPQQQVVFNQGTHVFLNFGAGDTTGVADALVVTSLPSGITDLTITMGDGNDTVVVTPSVATLPAGFTLTLDGGAGSDAFIFATDSKPVLTDTSFVFQKGATQYSIGLGKTFEIANISGGPGTNTFDVSGWTGSGSIDGQGGTDTLLAANDVANFGLSDSQFSRTGMGNIALTSIEQADLTGGAGANSFTVTGFSGVGTFNGQGGIDTLVDSENVANVTLSNTSLARTGLGTLTFTGIEVANLSGGAGANTFNVSAWSGSGTFDGAGGADIITATNDIAAFVLSDTSLARTGMGTLALAGIETANLTGGAGVNSFTVSEWTGSGTLDGAGGTDTLLATGDNATYDLADISLARSGSGTLALGSIEAVSLTGGAGINIFSVHNWTGTASLDGGAGNDTFHIALNGIVGTVNVTGGTEKDTLVIDGTDTVDLFSFNNGVVTRGAELISYTGIEEHVLNTLDGADNVTLNGNAFVTLDLGNADDRVNVTNFTGTGVIRGGAGNDTITSDNDADFTITAESFQRVQGGITTTFALEAVESTQIQGGASANTIQVSGLPEVVAIFSWGGNDVVTVSGGALVLVQAGSGNDTISVATDYAINIRGEADDDIVLLTGHGSLDADLGDGDDQVDVSGFTGIGNIKGGLGSNTLKSDNDADFTLTPTLFHRVQDEITTNLVLVDLASVQIQGGGSTNTIGVSGFSGVVSVSALGGNDQVTISGGSLVQAYGGEGDDTITVTSDGAISIKGETGNDTITVAGSGTLAVFGESDVGVFVGGDDSFEVSAHTGTGFIDGGTGINTLIAHGSGTFLLSDTAFIRDVLGGVKTLALAGIQVAQLTGGTSDDSFDVSGYHGAGTIEGSEGVNTIIATGDSDFELTPGTLKRSGGTAGTHGDIVLAHLQVAHLTGGASANTFNVSAWNLRGTITGVEPGGVKDTVIYEGDTNVRLSDDALTAFRMGSAVAPTAPVLQGSKAIAAPAYHVSFIQEGIDMNLEGVSRAIITGGAHKNILDAGDYSGEVTLVGGGDVDILIAGSGDSQLYGYTTLSPNGAKDPATNKPTDKTGGYDHFYVRDNPDGSVAAVIHATTRPGNTIHFRDSGVAVDYTLPKVGKLNRFLDFTKGAPTGLPVYVDAAHTFSVALASGYLSNLEGSKFDDRLKGNKVANNLWGGAGLDTLTAVGADARFGGNDGVVDLLIPKSKRLSLDADPINTKMARQRVFLIAETGGNAGLPTLGSFYYAPAVAYYESNTAAENLLAEGEAIYELRNAARSAG